MAKTAGLYGFHMAFTIQKTEHLYKDDGIYGTPGEMGKNFHVVRADLTRAELQAAIHSPGKKMTRSTISHEFSDHNKIIRSITKCFYHLAKY